MLNLRRSRALAFAALMVLTALLTSPTAAAAESDASAAWYPRVSPFYTNEGAYRHLDGGERSFWLNSCPAYYACVAVGEGDGEHTVFWLTECATRGVSDFMDAGAIRNNQRPPNDPNNWVRLYDFVNGNVNKVVWIPADNTTHGFDPYPIDQIDLC